MPVVYLLLFIGVGLLYLAYLACALPIGAVLAFGTCLLGMPIAYFRGLARVLVRRDPDWLSRAGPARWPAPPAGGDPAPLEYFYGPALADADHAVRTAYRDCRSLWRYCGGVVGSAFAGDAVLLTAPFGAGGAVGMAAGGVLGAAAATGCACVHLLTVGACAALVRAVGTILRLADSAVLRVKNIRMVCPGCGERVPYPGYECPGHERSGKRCTRRHRDIRPGRFGILVRHCECGTRMRTLLLLGSSGMNAFCPRCGQSLEHRPGKAPEIVLPLFGAADAGKTRLLLSLVTQLRLWSQDSSRGAGGPTARPGARLTVEFGDSVTARKLERASELLGPDSITAKTPPELPRAYIIRLITGQGSRILHMFDAAGELFYTAERTQELRFLDQARTFILVIDPLSVQAFWDRLPAERRAGLETVRSTAPSPEVAYALAHQEIEARGVPLRKSRLAVVFSRADLTDDVTGDVATWARDQLGLGNLVRSVRLNFGEACFFHTAAVLADGVMHESIPALLRWVLAADGIDLPREPS
jgi:Double-GTPase 2